MKAIPLLLALTVLTEPAIADARVTDPVMARPSAVTECLWQGMPQADRETLLRDAAQVGAWQAVARIRADPNDIIALGERCAPGAAPRFAVVLYLSEQERRAYLEELRARFGVSEDRLKAVWSALSKADRDFILGYGDPSHTPAEWDRRKAEWDRLKALADGFCTAVGASGADASMAMRGWLLSVGEISASLDGIEAAQPHRKN